MRRIDATLNVKIIEHINSKRILYSAFLTEQFIANLDLILLENTESKICIAVAIFTVETYCGPTISQIGRTLVCRHTRAMQPKQQLEHFLCYVESLKNGIGVDVRILLYKIINKSISLLLESPNFRLASTNNSISVIFFNFFKNFNLILYLLCFVRLSLNFHKKRTIKL